jgi:hypothetical protein
MLSSLPVQVITRFSYIICCLLCQSKWSPGWTGSEDIILCRKTRWSLGLAEKTTYYVGKPGDHLEWQKREHIMSENQVITWTGRKDNILCRKTRWSLGLAEKTTYYVGKPGDHLDWQRRHHIMYENLVITWTSREDIILCRKTRWSLGLATRFSYIISCLLCQSKWSPGVHTWVCTRLCKLQKGVHLTCSRKW